MARSAWRRLRELTLTSGRGSGRTGSTDEELEEETDQDFIRTEDTANGDDPLEHRGSDDMAVVGAFTVLALLFIVSALFIAFKAIVWHLDFSRTVVLKVMGSMMAGTLVTGLAWWAGRTWRLREKDSRGSSEVNPPAGRTEDDQNSVGTP
ncbi:hypothetical protein [Streptomyces kebangsaanensis]|uniref:hypothetical protein n=1 Tax=Streptomyces kebangsaanensis TaxID=864058 RepID=UPI0009A0AE5A|nr:hypothetical protein [Streptomyces kebangsaanensis]